MMALTSLSSHIAAMGLRHTAVHHSLTGADHSRFCLPFFGRSGMGGTLCLAAWATVGRERICCPVILFVRWRVCAGLGSGPREPILPFLHSAGKFHSRRARKTRKAKNQ